MTSSIRKALGIAGLSLALASCEPQGHTISAEKEIPLGSSVLIDVRDENGTLTTSEGLTVETSLTSSEDDYQTDVVLEVQRDAIKYHLNIPPNQDIEGRTFNLLGNPIKIERVGENNAIITSSNDSLEVFMDGDPFIGEDVDNPKWVWDIDTNNRLIGIENDFIHNDDSDNPRKVGECISLPNDYARICLDDLVIDTPNYDKSRMYFIEYSPSVDLSSTTSLLTPRPAIHIHQNQENKHPRKNIVLTPEVSTDEIWVTGDGNTYYSNQNSQVEYWQNIRDLTFGSINDEELWFFIAPSRENNGINVVLQPTTGINSSLSINFGVSDGEINSLGSTQSSEEARELNYRFNETTSYLGTKDEDHRTAYGTTIHQPRTLGATDEVVLTIPDRQVKASVNVYSKNQNTKRIIRN